MKSSGSKNLKRIVVVIALIASVWACRSTKQNLNKPPEPSPSPSAPATQSAFDIVDSKVIEAVSPFNHNRREHQTKTQDCAACHIRANNDPTPVFPGHAACNECHAKDFTNPESKMCIVCHQTPLDARASRISFTSRLAEFGLKRFSHRDHASPEKMRGQLDSQTAPDGAPRCDFCHRFDDRGLRASMPRHQECYSCHIHQPGQKLSACAACHVTKSEGMQYSAELGAAFRLYNFKHGSHLKSATCDRCHRTVDVPAGQTRADIQAINVARGQTHHSSCWSCHAQAKESVCSKCHVGSLPF